MGEIRARVRLVNALDEALARRGQIAVESVRSYEADALVDTGAVRSVIPVHVMQQLGLAARGQRVAEYADGRQEVVDVTEPVVFEVLRRDTLEEPLVLGDEVRIGQTVLEKAGSPGGLRQSKADTESRKSRSAGLEGETTANSPRER